MAKGDSISALTNVPDTAREAGRHALAWLVVSAGVGLWLSLLLLFPGMQQGEWTYGRWVPLHLNGMLYGWTALPLVGWLHHMYGTDRSKAAHWGPVSVWAWSGAMAFGGWSWLQGHSSGKIFLDWTGPARLTFVLAQIILWLVLAAAWLDQSRYWTRLRKNLTLFSLLGLATVPGGMWMATSPKVYPPVDPTTGGPSGSSLLGSTLTVILLFLILPRALALPQYDPAKKFRRVWVWFALSWVIFAIAEGRGGTHHDWWQIGSLACLLPWFVWVPADAARFVWPAHTRSWRRSMIFWWGALVLTGFLFYLPGILDRLKFTQGLVAHSHLAMAGFTTSFVGLLLSVLVKPVGTARMLLLWNISAVIMILVLAWMGWHEGGESSWMLHRSWDRWLGLGIRAACGLVMMLCALSWLRKWNESP
jgi:cytochrome c oxidase cbb3-type subunit I